MNQEGDRFLAGYLCGVVLMTMVAMLILRRRPLGAVTIAREFACRDCGEVLPRSEEYTCADSRDRTMRDRMCKRCMFLFSDEQQKSRVKNHGAESKQRQS